MPQRDSPSGSARSGVLPADVGLLRMIAAQPGRSQQSLAGELGVVPSRVVALVDNVERKGLIERRRNPQDRRNYALHLTAEGTDVMTKMRRIGAEHEDELCAALDETQRVQLGELLKAIAAQQGLTPGSTPDTGNAHASTRRRRNRPPRPPRPAATTVTGKCRTRWLWSGHG